MIRLPAVFLSYCLTLLVVTGMAAAASDPGAPLTLTIGGRPIVIPLPAGHARCDGISPEWDRAVASMLPASNRMLANFGSPDDQAAIRDGEIAPYLKSLNVQIMRSVENVEVDERTFDSVREENRKELENMKASIEAEVNKSITAGGRQLSEDLGVDLQLSVGDMAMLGIFEDSPTSLGFTMAMTTTVQAAGGEEKSRNVVSALLVPVNGRLLYLYSNSGYENEADRLAVESSVKAWRDAIVAANPRVKGSFLGSLTKGVGKSAAIGAIAGGIVAILAVLYRRFKR